ncbi:MAG: RNase adapter RapZ [Myxococcales bacterium]|nr:RNase adapter RapZ [Myxococcales bacterium]
MKIVIVTGLAGGGKTTALRALEDLGFFCCDNLPISLFSTFVGRLVVESIEKCAISVDGRQRLFVGAYHGQIAELRDAGHEVEVLFLEAADAVLFRRYSETRRRHPLSGDDVKEGIRQDREALASLRDEATVVNTGGLNVHEIKAIVTGRFEGGPNTLAVNIQSFGFKHGLPSESELVFDVRYLPNPYFDAVLCPHDGRDSQVSEFVLGADGAMETIDRIEDFLRFSLPLFAREGKLYITVGIGCTGGRHRSVALAEELARRLKESWHVLLRHRDLAKHTIRSLG